MSEVNSKEEKQQATIMATSQIPPPDPMVCSRNVAQQWKIFRDNYSDYMIATHLAEKDEKIHAAALVHDGKRMLRDSTASRDCRNKKLRSLKSS